MPIRVKGNQLGGLGITFGILLVLSSVFSPEFKLKSFFAGIGIIIVGVLFHRLTNNGKNPFDLEDSEKL